jgi:DHA1 family tetracycline resistance protein-like MFS transporter
MSLGMGIFVGIQLVSAPLLGRLSDKYGRKPIFIFSTIGTIISILFLYPIKIWSFFANRSLDGTTNGTYTVIRAAIIDISEPKDIVKNVGMEGTIASIGFVLGPMLSGILLSLFNFEGSAATEALVSFALFICCINLVLCLMFKETLLVKNEASIEQVWKEIKSSFNLKKHIHTIKEKNKSKSGFIRLVFLQICLALALGYYHYFVTYISFGSLRLDTKQISYVFIIFGAMNVVSNLLFYTFFIDKINHVKFIKIMSFIGILTFVAYAFFAKDLWWLSVIMLIDCFTISLVPGLLEGINAEYAEENDRGELSGMMQSIQGMASLITIFLFGILASVDTRLPFLWFSICLFPLVWLNIKKA